MNLLEDLFGQGYDLTMDNYFVSLSLAKKLLQKKTSILMRLYCRSMQGGPDVTEPESSVDDH